MEDNKLIISQGIHVIAKPVGATCNLACDYCFYLEKEALYPDGKKHLMSDDVLKRYIETYVQSQPTTEVEFVWHGGEPTLAGIDFYKKVVEYQRPFLEKKIIRNSIQTNGSLLTDKWCEFFKENAFFIGISLDGPEEVHNRYRHNRKGNSTFADVMRGVNLLQDHGVPFNILACVARETARYPLEVYHFFKDIGAQYIQFTPIVERLPDEKTEEQGLTLASPCVLDHEEINTEVTSWTVGPEEYGNFLNTIFDEWVRRDVGQIFVMNFEWALNAAIHDSSPVCIFTKQCGHAVAVEHTGDVYACDHYVYPEYHLGNVLRNNLSDLVNLSLSKGFGFHKEQSLPKFCRECSVLRACWGGCPKHRFKQTIYGEPGLHFLCAGYKKFFNHISKYMIGFKKLLEYGLTPETIMQAIDHPLIVPASEKTDNKQVVLWIK